MIGKWVLNSHRFKNKVITVSTFMIVLNAQFINHMAALKVNPAFSFNLWENMIKKKLKKSTYPKHNKKLDDKIR